jgi:ankyrin repeat protein
MRCGFLRQTPLQILLVTYANHDTNFDENKLIRILEVFFQHAVARIGDPNLCDISGRTLLHYAASFIRSRAVIDILLGKGEYRSIGVVVNVDGTPMDVAIAFGNTVAMGAIRDWAFRQAG